MEEWAFCFCSKHWREQRGVRKVIEQQRTSVWLHSSTVLSKQWMEKMSHQSSSQQIFTETPTRSSLMGQSSIRQPERFWGWAAADLRSQYKSLLRRGWWGVQFPVVRLDAEVRKLSVCPFRSWFSESGCSMALFSKECLASRSVTGPIRSVLFVYF